MDIRLSRHVIEHRVGSFKEVVLGMKGAVTALGLVLASLFAVCPVYGGNSTTKGDKGMEVDKFRGDGFQVVIAHSLEKVRRSGPEFKGLNSSRVVLDAARDETESFQLVVMPNAQSLENVRVEVSELGGPDGAVQIEWNKVGYVETAPPSYETEYVGWWPDPLLPPGPFDVNADERQPLWFNVIVPPDAKPGRYNGEITICHGDSSVSVPVEIRVRNFRLPRPGTLATAFGLYLPFLARWWYGDEPTKMPIEVYARWCEFLGKYRLAPKNFAREYETFTHDEGTMSVDRSRLKETIADLTARYYAPYSFALCRLPSAHGLINAETEREPPAYFAEFVRAHAEEWERQDLPPEVFIYGIDEPPNKEYPFLRAVYAKIHEVAPSYPITQTINDPSPQDLVGLVDIWCPLTPKVGSEFYAKRKAAGDTLWTYVCCGPKPPHANFFVDEPATDHRVVFWQAHKYGATGFLYWGVCIWDGLPMPSSGEECFPDVPIRLKEHYAYTRFEVNGDGLLVYPGHYMEPLSSIRLEVIRDGIEDYEYLAMLSRLVEKAKTLSPNKRPEPELIQRAEELCIIPETISRTLTDYTKDPERIFQQRSEIADMLECLTDLLGSAE